MHKSAPREISYSSSVKSRPGKAFVRIVENATGRVKLIKRAIGYEHELARGQDFWKVMIQRFGLSLDITRGSLESIPKTGPIILVSNHPFGILDGLAMGHILSQTRPDFRILANSIFSNADDINKVILPVSFDKRPAAVKTNIQTRKDALAHLAENGAIGIFPGGTVSTARKPFGRPMDPEWRSFTAKMIAKSKATVVPIFFEGSNSRLFQVCSHIHPTLRTALFVSEFKRKTDEPIKISIGDPLSRDVLNPYCKDPQALMDFLRDETYRLSPKPFANTAYGYEFEKRDKSKTKLRY
jgi:putative hemolysin